MIKFSNNDKVREAAKEYCRLTGLQYRANSGDGYLDVAGQRDIPFGVWMTQLRHLTQKPWDIFDD